MIVKKSSEAVLYGFVKRSEKKVKVPSVIKM